MTDRVAADSAGPRPGRPDHEAEPPLRVSTLEIFFDLVFAFTLTQLTSVLAARVSWPTIGKVLLIFGLLWWWWCTPSSTTG
jgi:low temperature requirement protein LtrA